MYFRDKKRLIKRVVSIKRRERSYNKTSFTSNQSVIKRKVFVRNQDSDTRTCFLKMHLKEKKLLKGGRV